MSEVHIFEEAFAGLPKRVINSLVNSDYDSLEELHDLSDKELTGIKGVTKNSISEIRSLLAANGFVKEFVPDPEAVAAVATGKQQVSRVASGKENDRKPASGKKSGRKPGQVVMLINLVDHGYRRKNNGQRLSVVIGDVIWGNKDKEWDLPRDYVDMLIAEGSAA